MGMPEALLYSNSIERERYFQIALDTQILHLEQTRAVSYGRYRRCEYIGRLLIYPQWEIEQEQRDSKKHHQRPKVPIFLDSILFHSSLNGKTNLKVAPLWR